MLAVDVDMSRAARVRRAHVVVPRSAAVGAATEPARQPAQRANVSANDQPGPGVEQLPAVLAACTAAPGVCDGALRQWLGQGVLTAPTLLAGGQPAGSTSDSAVGSDQQAAEEVDRHGIRPGVCPRAGLAWHGAPQCLPAHAPARRASGTASGGASCQRQRAPPSGGGHQQPAILWGLAAANVALLLALAALAARRQPEPGLAVSASARRACAAPGLAPADGSAWQARKRGAAAAAPAEELDCSSRADAALAGQQEPAAGAHVAKRAGASLRCSVAAATKRVRSALAAATGGGGGGIQWPVRRSAASADAAGCDTCELSPIHGEGCGPLRTGATEGGGHGACNSDEDAAGDTWAAFGSRWKRDAAGRLIRGSAAAAPSGGGGTPDLLAGGGDGGWRGCPALAGQEGAKVGGGQAAAVDAWVLEQEQGAGSP